MNYEIDWQSELMATYAAVIREMGICPLVYFARKQGINGKDNL